MLVSLQKSATRELVHEELEESTAIKMADSLQRAHVDCMIAQNKTCIFVTSGLYL